MFSVNVMQELSLCWSRKKKRRHAHSSPAATAKIDRTTHERFRIPSVKCPQALVALKGLEGPDFLFSGIFFAPASEIKNQEFGSSEMISVPVHLQHKSQKWKVPNTLSLKDMR